MNVPICGTKTSRAGPVFDLFAQLPKSDEDLRKHVSALSRMTEQREHQELFDHLYECLSILDSKSSSLLGFNSIIIAVFAIFMTGGSVSPVQWCTIAVGMAGVVVSCLLLLWVVWIHWSSTENLADLENHALVLLNVRRSRTIMYRLAWYLAVGAILCLSVFAGLRVLAA